MSFFLCTRLLTGQAGSGKWSAGSPQPSHTHLCFRSYFGSSSDFLLSLIRVVSASMGSVCQRASRPVEDQLTLVPQTPHQSLPLPDTMPLPAVLGVLLPLPDTVPLSAGIVVPRCSTPCPCCFYTLSTDQNGLYTMGWRKFGGEWSWWHRGGPHAFVDRCDVSRGINGPGTPACACCYYRTLAPGTVGPGWFLNHRQHWRWSEHQAPHASGAAWPLQVDDAHFMRGRPTQGNAGPTQTQLLSDMQDLASARPPPLSEFQSRSNRQDEHARQFSATQQQPAVSGQQAAAASGHQPAVSGVIGAHQMHSTIVRSFMERGEEQQAAARAESILGDMFSRPRLAAAMLGVSPLNRADAPHSFTVSESEDSADSQ